MSEVLRKPCSDAKGPVLNLYSASGLYLKRQHMFHFIWHGKCTLEHTALKKHIFCNTFPIISWFMWDTLEEKISDWQSGSDLRNHNSSNGWQMQKKDSWIACAWNFVNGHNWLQVVVSCASPKLRSVETSYSIFWHPSIISLKQQISLSLCLCQCTIWQWSDLLN